MMKLKPFPPGDYLMIESLQDGAGSSADNFAVKGPATTATAKTVNKICGFLFNAIAGNAGTALATACSYKTPFRVGVHFDRGEAIALTPNAAAGNNLNAAENAILNPSTAGEGIGTSGFWLAYWQQSC